MFGIIGPIDNGGVLSVAADVTLSEVCELDGPMRGGGVESLVWTTFFDGGALATG